MNKTVAMIAGAIVGFAGLAAWASGDLNPSFGTNGAVNVDFEGRATDALQVVREQANGSFLAAGREFRPRPDTGGETNTFGFIANVSANGSVMGTPVAVNLASEFRDISGVSVPADDTVFFSGTIGTPPAVTGLKLVRTNAAGVVNGRYARGASGESPSGFCRNAVREPNGKIAMSCVVLSQSNTQNVGIVRLNSNLTEDTSFGATGDRGTVAIPNRIVGGVSYSKQFPPSGNNNLVRDPVDGSYYVLTRALNEDFTRSLILVAKFNSTGQIIKSFGTDGVATAADCGTSCSTLNASDMVLDTSSGTRTLLVAGTITASDNVRFGYYVTRLNATNGTGISGFGTGGIALIPGDAGREQRPTAILPTADGIYLLRQGSNLIRLQGASGAIDTGYTAFGTDIGPLNRKNAKDLSRWFGMVGIDGGALLLGGVSQCAGVASNDECSASGSGTSLSSQATVAKFRFAADETPDGFSFNTLTDQPVSTVVTSSPATLTGFTVPVAISVGGAAGSAYSIGCNGTFTGAAGTINSGQSVCVRHTTAATTSTTTVTTLNVGTASTNFSSTTVAPIPDDTTPDAFTFTAQSGVALTTPRTSNSVTIGGINVPAPISISGGTGAGYSIGCTDTFTATAGTISNGQTVCVRQTSAGTPETPTTTTLAIGSVSAAFQVTTAAAVPQPAISVSPASLAFESQQVDTSAVKTAVLTNSGNAALTITSIIASGDGFAATSDCLMLAAGGSCTISVTFTPTATGARTGGVSIITNAASSPDTLTLSGTGTPPAGAQPAVSLAPQSLMFDPLIVGATSPEKSVTLTNSGTADLTITGLSASGDFALTAGSNCVAMLAAQQSCTFGVTFTPTGSGERSGSVTIASNAPPSSSDVLPLNGTGSPLLPATLTPANPDLGGIAVGSTSSQFVTLRNTGTQPFTFTASADGDFTVRTSGCDDLPAGGSCTLTVDFAPTAIGARSGTLRINSANSGVLTASLSGRGLSSRFVQTDIGRITLTASQGVVESFAQVETPAGALPQYNYALGFFGFRITGLPVGVTSAVVRVSFTLPAGVPFNTYVKCNAGQCAVPDGVEVNGNVLTITLADNGAGDSDSTPGVIADPGAPAQSNSSGGGSSGGGGALGLWTLALLGVPALLRRRRR